MAVTRPSLSASLLGDTLASAVTLDALFQARVQRSPEAEACRWFDRATQQWQSLSWQALDGRVARFTAALAGLGLARGARVALMLDNGPDWVAAEQAIYRLGLISVGIYVHDTPGNAAHILDNAGAAAVFVRDAETWLAIEACQQLPALKTVVLAHGPAGDRTPTLEAFLDAAPLAQPLAASAAAVSGPTDLASLVYTSGTTGAAKGAMLSHAALLANVRACAAAFAPAIAAEPVVVKLSLLPLSHSFERVAGWHHAVLIGATTVFSRGPDQLAEDFRTVRPTAFLGVPRIYERLYARLSAALLNGPLPQRALFHLALSGHHSRFSQRLTRRLVHGVQQHFGGRLKLAISGGAPLSPEIGQAFTALGVPLLQGYGLTEAGPVVSVQRGAATDADSVGLPLDGVETMVAPDGELLVRSPSQMLGYWQDPDATRRVLDDAGWLHTGDKASRLSGEALVLTGRIKDVLVMSTGVKACPAEIEARLTADPLFEQALVIGESRPYLVALLVADEAALVALRRHLSCGFDAGQPVPDAALEAALLERCRGRLANLAQSHQLRRVALVAPFTLANGLVTTTLKLRRAAIAKRDAAVIEALYSGHCQGYKTDCAANAELRCGGGA